MKWGVSLLLPFLFFGCAHKPKALPTGLTQTQFWKNQKIREDFFQKISGKLSLRYRNKKDSISGKGRIFVQFPNQMRTELRDSFGRLHYEAVLDGKQFMAYYPSQKQAFVDSVQGAKYLESVLGCPLPFPEVQWLFLGRLPARATAKFTSWEWDDDKAAYRAENRAHGDHWIVFIDGKTAAVKELRVESSRCGYTVKYEDFDACCEPEKNKLVLAHELVLERPGALIGVAWDEVRPLAKSLPSDVFQIRLEGDVQKIPLN